MDATVINLGLTPDGKLEVPSDFSQTGWWSGGSKPGTVGPAVIVGHIDNKYGPAVFYRLRELVAGNKVYVFRAGRSPVTYVVDTKGQWPKDNFPSELVYDATVKPTLRLVTCGGAFNSAIGHYVDNTIVFGHMIG